MIRINIEKIKKLRNYLDDTCYDTLNQKIRQHQNYFFNPLPNEYDNIQLELLKLKKDKRVLLKLLLLGDKIELNEIENTIGTEFLNLLIELGIVIKSDGYVQTDSYIIISFLDKYFLVGLPYNNPNCRIKDPSVYIGMDTYRLTENITSKRVDKVLDLCAGSGIQGICAANKANSVTLVEINHKTIPFTKFNIVLNNVEDKVRVKEGSLYENLGNATFDEIYVNPPFIAVPQDWNFPIAGNGGENGLEITLNIIRGYKRHLSKRDNTVKENPREELKKIEISDLTYSFSSNLTLYKNFNLEINKGEIVGIVGNNGVGKSTLIKIIMKMIPIDIGRIIVNGKYGLENIDEEYLYKNISVVPQSTVILSGKLRDILNPAKRDISDNKIIETLKKFTVDYSIFENDLNYEILEKGGNMSGGEAQKLSLVRMVLENKPWVLLDEPTSAMDVECEKIICSILKEYLKRRTAVIITHRPEILSICDKIIRLES